MAQVRLLALVFGTLVVIGTTLAVVTSDSREAQGTATYAGQQTCMTSGCHADSSSHIYRGAAEFRKTMHANIHNRPTPENVIIDRWFREKRVLKFRETKVQAPPGDTLFIELSKGETENDYLIQLRTIGPYADSTGWLKVAYNYGGNGWLQRFLVEVDGSYYVMPFQYVLGHYRETDSDTGKVYFLDLNRWYQIDTGTNAISFYDFKSNNFLKQSWDNNCAACHVNGFDVSSVQNEQGNTQWFSYWVGAREDSAISDQNIAIGCESCHGPGSDHAADHLNESLYPALSPRRWDPSEASTFWTDRKLDLCNQCHNRHRSTTGAHTYQYDDEAGQPYLPGLELADYVTDLKSGGSYWNDGKTSYAHHQTGQDYWRSGHYSKHVFKNGCYDCHSPHADVKGPNGEAYPYQLNRNWYSLQRGEGCVAFGCHANFASTIDKGGKPFNVHAQHLNEHSQCVNCHYTKTATIAFVGTFEFSDHSDQVIRPNATRIYADISYGFRGVPNTCAASCHRNGYGERNRPDAFDENIAVKLSMGDDVTPMRAPDFGIVDQDFDGYRTSADLRLADSLWEGYKRLFEQYVTSVRVGNANAGTAGSITSILPNPAREVARIRFNLPRAGKIRLEVYDSQGKPVRVIADNHHEAGSYQDEWDGSNELNGVVPSGIYFIRLVGENFTSVKSITFLR